MIKVGETLILEPKFAQHEEKYKCMVVEQDEGCVFIDYPVNIETGKISFLMDGTQLKVTYTDSENAVYIFESEVLGRLKANIPMVQLSCPATDGFLKIQRRHFVRIGTVMDAAVHPEDREFMPFTTITEDISAGGAALVVPKNTQIDLASKVYIWLVLPFKSGEIQYLRLKSEVIRLFEEKDGRMMLSVQFVDNTESDTQTLFRFIFEKQLDRKKKELAQ